MKKLLAFLFLAALVRAANPVPYTEGVSFSFRLAGAGSGTMTVYGEGPASLNHSVSGSTTESATATAWLRPGRQYTVNLQASGPTDYWLSYTAPQGYVLTVNGVASNLTARSPGGGWYSHDYTLELRPVGDLGATEFGQFLGVELGKSVTWEVGLGKLGTGRSAGRLCFKEYDLAGSPAARDRAYYSPPPSYGEAWTIRDGASNQRLRQVLVPQGVVDLIDDVGGGYWIRFFPWSQAEGSPGNPFILYGSPWKTIRVETPGANQLKLTETEGSAVRVTLATAPSAASGNYTWTVQEGGPSSNWLRTTTHTSTLTTVAPATGGTITASGGYTIHTFAGSGTFTASQALTVEALVVAGGGGGGGGLINTMNAGGGGGGGVRDASALSLSATAYSVTVGAGGASGTNGGNSSFFSLTALGGGHGAHAAYAAPGAYGGSGGGEGTAQGGGAGAGASGQGTAGAPGAGAPYYEGGGGGGASSGGSGINGGHGYGSWITGGAAYYGGGGGAGTNDSVGGPGGLGGGGSGGGSSAASGANGAANTGGGGGGSAQWSSTGGSGGSGVVIVRYLPQAGMSFREVVAETRTGGAAGPVVAKAKYRYENPGGWGEEVVQTLAYPTASTPDSGALTTAYTYHTDANACGNYRRVRSVTGPGGGWIAYSYYDDWDKRGQLQYEYRPFLDSPATATLNPASGRVVNLDYAVDWTGRHTRPTARYERVNNVLTATTDFANADIYSADWPREFTNIFPRANDSPSSQLTENTEVYRADAGCDAPGLLYVHKRPDLSQASHSYSNGSWDGTTFSTTAGIGWWRHLVLRGSSSSTGAESLTSWDGQSFAPIWLVPHKSTLEAVIHRAGLPVRRETWVYTGSGAFALLTWENLAYNSQWRLTQTVTTTGATTTFAYTNGRLTSTTDPSGTETQFAHDELGRVVTSIKKGAAASGSYAAQGDITTTFTYDGANRVTQTVSSGGALSQTTTSTYDLAGRLTQSVAPGGYTTGFAYTSGGKIVTATLPGGTTRIDETYLDGRTKSVTGTAVVASYATYTVNSGGTVTTQVNAGTSTSTALVKTTTDWLGRPITEERPSPTGAGTVSLTLTYNSLGQLTKRTQPGLADTLYSYDTLGALFREGLDVGANGILDLASSDRITERGYTFFTTGGNWWRRETTTTYATASSSTATQVGKVEAQISGLPTNRFTRTDTTDIFGNVTSQYVDVNRSGKLVTTTTDAPDSTTDAVTIAYNGLTMSSRNTANQTTTFGHDALGRPVTSIDPRTGTTTTAYVTGTNQVSTVTDPASIVQATYGYDSAGRVSSVKDALNKYAYTSYTNRNEVYRQWGDTTYPVEYGYDTWGRRTTMKTYRAGTGWTGSTWPASPGTADTTTWAYQEATGLLSSKTDGASKAVSYTYTQAGQLATVAKPVAGTTTFSYDSLTGEQTTIDYLSGTTDVSAQYNRLGQLSQVTDATGTRTFDHCVCGKVTQENFPSGFYGSRSITYALEQTVTGSIGRTKGYTLYLGGTAEQDVAYGFDTYGRLNSVAGSGVTFAHTHTPNSNLLASISDGSSGWTQTRSYLSNRDLLDVIETKVSTTSKVKFDYAHDSLGRRTGVAKSGDFYGRYGNGTQGLDTTWGYDDRSQVTSEVSKLGGSSTVLGGRDDAFAFDNLGNRTTTTHNGNTSTYTANTLNQYTQRIVPGIFDVAGAAASGATVTVNSSSTGVTRHGEYFFKSHALSNSSGAAYSVLDVSDGSTSVNLPAFVAQTPEQFVHDDDGQMLRDGRWEFTWDAAGRLVAAQSRSTLSPVPLPNAEAQRLEFVYDYRDRRVGKTVRGGWNGTAFTTVISDVKFLYYGNNLIAEYDVGSGGALTLARTRVWGVDWSGTRQGAGGVGGMLLVHEAASGAKRAVAYDGNGNVMGLIDRASGAFVAEYEYDAFGNTLRESGGAAAANCARFSTKYTDLETGLVYYGRRFYAPSTGRWLSRDPIEEQGGLNLYGFVRNNPLSLLDYLGMDLMWLDMGGRFNTEDILRLPKMVVTAYRQSAAEKGWIIDMLSRTQGSRGDGGGGGGNGGRGTANTGNTPAPSNQEPSDPDDTAADDVNTPPPGSETVALDTFVVTGTRPTEPPQVRFNNTSVTRTISFNLDHYMKCAGFALQIATAERIRDQYARMQYRSQLTMQLGRQTTVTETLGSVQTNSAFLVGAADTLNTTSRQVQGLGPYLNPELTGTLRVAGALTSGFDAYRAANGFIEGNYSEGIGNTASVVTAFTLAGASNVSRSSFTFGSNFLRAVGGPVTAIGTVAVGFGNVYVDHALDQEARNDAGINAIYDERLSGRMINSANATITAVRQHMTNEKCN
jgi:RHS repeat-associated protein